MIHLGAFTINQLQIAEAVLRQCGDMSVPEIINHIGQQRQSILAEHQNLTKSSTAPAVSRRNTCPQCGNTICKMAVHIEKCPKVGGYYTILTYCQCGWESLS